MDRLLRLCIGSGDATWTRTSGIFSSIVSIFYGPALPTSFFLFSFVFFSISIALASGLITLGRLIGFLDLGWLFLNVLSESIVSFALSYSALSLTWLVIKRVRRVFALPPLQPSEFS